jgi:thiol-disulfide isomerase/thioredoxin
MPGKRRYLLTNSSRFLNTFTDLPIIRLFLLMKNVLFFAVLVFYHSAFAQQDGYEIKVTFKPFKNQYIYLGHYFGKQYPVIDSAMLNDKSEAVFKGNKKLGGGIYLVGYPNRAGFFEILVDKQQHFSVWADTATIADGIQFENSPDNVLFSSYQKEMADKGAALNYARERFNIAATAADSAYWKEEINRLDKIIKDYREEIIKNNPGSILSVLLTSMREPEMPEALKNPKTKQDSVAAYTYYRTHFWDGVNFWDGRLTRTTFFEGKLDKYINEVMYPNPDSVIKDMDRMLAYASVDEDMTKVLLLKFVNRFLNQKFMWEDKVFVHLFEKYFASKDYAWLTEQGRKTITERAYNLMANILGTPASDILLPDSSGKEKSLYALQAEYTLVCFWDPLCGHCKEVVPKLDSMYLHKWKAAGLKIFAVAKETDGTQKDWTAFISEHKLHEWTHVYYSKSTEKKRIDAGIPGYSQLYDVMSFPTLYLLDKEKRIVAKKLTYEQMDEVLKLKLQGK